jgi:anti-anti-sigma factor
MAQSSVVSVEHLPAAVVVNVLSNNLGKSEVDALCSATDAARVIAPSLPFIIDMTNVGFAGSVVMGVLVGLNQEFRNRKQGLIFVSLQANLHDAFNITRISKIVEIMTDVPTALRSLEASS